MALPTSVLRAPRPTMGQPNGQGQTVASQVAAFLRNHADTAHSIIAHMKGAGDPAALSNVANQVAPALDAHAAATNSLGKLLGAVQQNPSVLTSPITAPNVGKSDRWGSILSDGMNAIGAGAPPGGAGIGSTIARLVQQHGNDATAADVALGDHGIAKLASSVAQSPDLHQQMLEHASGGIGSLGAELGMPSGNEPQDHGDPILSALQTTADHSHGIASLLGGLKGGNNGAGLPGIGAALAAHGASLGNVAQMVGSEPGPTGMPAGLSSAPTQAAPIPSGALPMAGLPAPSASPSLPPGIARPSSVPSEGPAPGPDDSYHRAFLSSAGNAADAIQRAGGRIPRSRADAAPAQPSDSNTSALA